jgi:glycosyltransferase involved in cell wall biosynthesis
MRIFLIQHHLADKQGHSYHETLAWKRYLERTGCDFRLFINHRAAPEIVAETGGAAVFPFAPGNVSSVDPVTGRLESYIELGGLFARTLGSSLADVAAADAVILPFSTDIEVRGAALWLESLAAARRPNMVFIFHAPDFDWRVDPESAGLTGNISYHRLAAQQIKQLLPAERMFFYATNEKLARVLGNVMQLPFADCPVPVEDFDAPVDTPVGGERFHVGVIGGLRPETGSEVVAGVLARFCRARPDKRVFVQGSDAQVEAIAARLEALSGARCGFWRGAMTREDYFRHLQSLEILLLPYMRERYDCRVSGSFTEAVGRGIVCVVPDKSWMARQLRAGWGAGVPFDALSEEAVSDALLQASDQLAGLQARAAERKDEWRKRQNVTSMIEQVLGGLRQG